MLSYVIKETVMQVVSSNPPLNVLFLCTGNSARSIIAECILNRLGAGKFKAYSAGSYPRGEVNPHALAVLRKSNFDVSKLRSKSSDEFTGPEAPKLDFVFTVCDNAAKEVCPLWPGQPMTAHWGLPDPAAVEGSEAEQALAFADCFRMLYQRIGIFVSLPFDKLSKLALQKHLEDIGRRSLRTPRSRRNSGQLAAELKPRTGGASR
jgi:protein-tyrosine-phosphatase